MRGSAKSSPNRKPNSKDTANIYSVTGKYPSNVGTKDAIILISNAFSIADPSLFHLILLL